MLPPTTPPSPALPDEIIEEIFLRIPPNEPAYLVHASLASQLWRALLSGPSFHGRYREFHGAPPMLGFGYTRLEYSSQEPAEESPVRRFVCTTKFGARIPDGYLRGRKYDVWDCRHGRVLLGGARFSPTMLVIWNPITGSWIELYPPKAPTQARYRTYGAAVLCRVTGCDHRSCHKGPFRVVLVSLEMINGDCVAFAHVSLPHKEIGSESCSYLGEWSKPCSGLHLPSNAVIDFIPPVLVEDALYFMLSYDYDDDNNDGDDDDDDYDDDHHRISVLKYDLVSNCLSLIDGPLAETYIDGNVALMVLEDGNLGFARLNMLTLHFWSKKMGFDGVAPWNDCRVIDLKEFLPIQNPKKKIRLIGSVEGSDIVFVTTDLGTYEISLKTLRWKKIWKREIFLTLVPYMSFYNP